MKRQLTTIVLILAILGVSSPGAKGNWPNGKKAAIVLTYDDGLDSHLNIAIPQLNKFDFKSTFFLYGHIAEKDISEWRKVSHQGHELGNHSLFHPCSGNGSIPLSPRFISENYDVPSMMREIEAMNKLLFAITGEHTNSYAYPCSEMMIGGIDYSTILGASDLIRFARCGGDRSIITDFKGLNYFKVPTFAVPPGSDSTVLIDYAKDVLKKGGVGIYVFHGIGGDYLSINAKDHLALLEYLSVHYKEIWVATFNEVMEYIQNNVNK